MAALTRQEVATAFVKNYYCHLRQSSEDVHKFYKDSSILSRLGPDGVLNHWTISEAIDNRVVTYFDYFDCKEFVLLSIDAQLSIGLGVHVLVIGCVTMDNNTKRRFTQSFVLAPMNKPNAYLILNDVLRLLDEEKTSKTCVQGVDSTTYPSLDPVPADIALKEAVAPEKSKTCVEGVDSIADPDLDPVPVDIVPNEEVQKDAAAASCVKEVDSIPDPSRDPVATVTDPNEAVQEVLKDATTCVNNGVDLIADPSLAPVSADIVPNEKVPKDATAASCVKGVDSTPDPIRDPEPTVTAPNEVTAATTCVNGVDLIADPSLAPVSADIVQEVPKDATAASCVKGVESIPGPSLDPVPTDIAPNEAFQEVLKDANAATTCVNGVDSSHPTAVPSQEPVPVDIPPKKAVQEIEKDATAAAPPKKSFLTIVNALNENNAPFKAPPVKKSVSTTIKESKGKSIFVRNLAMDVKVEELHQAFKKYGPIKLNGVKTISDHMKNRCFAFIEFESSSSAQNAIQASSIRIGNRKVHIEEKKISYINTKNTKFPPASSIGNGLLTRSTRQNGPVN